MLFRILGGTYCRNWRSRMCKKLLFPLPYMLMSDIDVPPEFEYYEDAKLIRAIARIDCTLSDRSVS
jgi:hypothetical protein